MSSYEIPATAVTRAKPARNRRWSTRWISGLTLVGLLAIWWVVTASGLIEPLFLPPPSAVLQKGWLLATTGYMDWRPDQWRRHLSTTGQRAARRH